MEDVTCIRLFYRIDVNPAFQMVFKYGPSEKRVEWDLIEMLKNPFVFLRWE